MLGIKADGYLTEYMLDETMFYQKGRGVPGYIKDLAGGTVREPNNYVRETAKDTPKWTTGKMDPALRAALDAGLESTILEAIRFYDEGKSEYLTSIQILSHIYALGILSDVLRNVHQITTSDNSFLLSDAGEVLSLITGADQSSFIWEKAGNRYDNFMIDEFQIGRAHV